MGCKNGVLKYIDTNKDKMVSVNTDLDEFIGDIILLEKIRVIESDEEYFHKNLNFILVGSKKLGNFKNYIYLFIKFIYFLILYNKIFLK